MKYFSEDWKPINCIFIYYIILSDRGLKMFSLWIEKLSNQSKTATGTAQGANICPWPCTIFSATHQNCVLPFSVESTDMCFSPLMSHVTAIKDSKGLDHALKKNRGMLYFFNWPTQNLTWKCSFSLQHPKMRATKNEV